MTASLCIWILFLLFPLSLGGADLANRAELLAHIDSDQELSSEFFDEFFGFASKDSLVANGGKIIVNCGIELQDVRSIDAAKGTFSARGFLWYYWENRKMSYPEGVVESLKWPLESVRNRIWIPDLDFDNSVEEVKVWGNTVEVFPTGRIEHWFYFSGVFTDQDGLMDFRRFPCEELPLVIDVNTPYTIRNVEMAFCKDSVPQDMLSELVRKRHPEFRFGKPSAHTFQRSYSSEWNREFSTLRMKFMARRNKGYYFLHTILPVLAILLVFLSGQRISQQQFEAKVGLSLTCLLSLIAYTFTFSDQLPKVGYVTLMDLFVTANYVFIAIGTSLVAVECWVPNPPPVVNKIFNCLKSLITPISFLFVLVFIILFAFL
jgi:hypothetical protein